MLRFILYTLFVFPVTLLSQTYSGRIIRVIDGDVFLFQTKDSTFTVYMYGVDAPETGQTFGPQTIDHMETYLWADAEIQLKNDLNQEGICALLFIKGTNINNKLVKNGYAWYNKLRSIDADLARSEVYARENKLGLWMSDNPCPPWDFREGKLAKPQPPANPDNVLICTNQKDNCYHKRYCEALLRCQANVIVITKEQAKELKMKACRHCY